MMLSFTEAQDASLAGADAVEDDAPSRHEIIILSQVLPERGNAY